MALHIRRSSPGEAAPTVDELDEPDERYAARGGELAGDAKYTVGIVFMRQYRALCSHFGEQPIRLHRVLHIWACRQPRLGALTHSALATSKPGWRSPGLIGSLQGSAALKLRFAQAPLYALWHCATVRAGSSTPPVHFPIHSSSLRPRSILLLTASRPGPFFAAPF